MMTFYNYDATGQLTHVARCSPDAARLADLAARDHRELTAFAFEHDPDRKVFRLTALDGSTEVFRDNSTRYLCVAPDEKTGAMRPVMKHGRPVYLHLCRQEREGR